MAGIESDVEPHRTQAPPLPGLRGLPIVGVVPRIARAGGILPFLLDCWQRYGDTFRLDLGHTQGAVAIHPREVERVLSSENYVKGKTYDGLRQLVGDGMLTLEGPAWKSRRQLEQSHFQRRAIAPLVATMARVTAAALDRMRGSLPEGGVIDVQREMTRLTLEIVVETFFGGSAGMSGETPMAAFREALGLVSDRTESAVPLPLWLPTPANLRLRRALRAIDAVVHRTVESGRASHGGDDGEPTLLRTLLAARDPQTGQLLSARQVRDEIVTILLAGHETTALALTWAFPLLDDQRPVVERMREEVRAVMGDRLPTAQDANGLTYVRMVIDEILRLRPPAWTVARDAAGDDELGGFAVRRGTRVLTPAYLTHRHPEFWPNPEFFDPERFSAKNREQRERWAYYPFSSGPRICIGFTFALVEISVVLAVLLQRCEFRLDAKTPIPPEGRTTLHPAAPVRLRIDWND